jgi:diacylglycerol kinase
MTKSESRMSEEVQNPKSQTTAWSTRPSVAQPGALDVSQTYEPQSSIRDFDDSPDNPRRRPAWRQRLVEAERGLVRGVRSDSVFFVHFFGICIVLAAAFVFHIGWMQWIAIAGCLTLVLTAEMFNQGLKTIVHASNLELTPGGQRAMAIGTAAVLVACIGSTIVLTLVFWQRFGQLFDG